MSADSPFPHDESGTEGPWIRAGLPADTLERLAALPMAAWVPSDIPGRFELEGLSVSAGDFGDMYVLWFGASDESIFGVTGVPGGIGSVLPGDRQTSCQHPSLGGGDVEWYDDPEAPWEFSSPWLHPASNEFPVYGVFGRGLTADEVRRLVASLEEVPARR